MLRIFRTGITSTRPHLAIRQAIHISRYNSSSTLKSTQKTLRPSKFHPSLYTQRCLFLALGLGTTSAVAFALLSSQPSSPFSRQSTIHADSNPQPRPQANANGDRGRIQMTENSHRLYSFDEVVEAEGGAHIESQPAQGVWRRDSFQLGSNFPIEDVISNADFAFSPTLTLSCVTILDGHNGQRIADLLGQLLPITVLSHVADVYSKHAQSISSAFGFDVTGGQEVQFADDQEQDEDAVHHRERNPGEPPDPVPPGEEVDAAIREAFTALDDFLVHESVRRVFGLDEEAYAALCARNTDDGKEASKADGKEGENKKDEATVGAGSATNSKNTMSRAQAMEKLSYPNSGSCALMALFNPQERSLRLALTGDLRAVFGRRVLAPPDDSNGKGKNASIGSKSSPRYVYEVEQLTADQNALNPAEAARLTSEHPNEPDLLKNNRVLGWGPARAFGDGVMKWCAEVQRRLHEEFLGDRLRDNCKTPPYFTAEPVVTTKEDLRRGDFVVLASDGLWDCLGSEEVVGLVGMWLEERGLKERVKQARADAGSGIKELLLPSLPRIEDDDDPDTDADHHRVARLFHPSQKQSNTAPKVYTPSELPVIYPADYKDRTPMYRYWRTEKKFVCEDENIATHLTRNALGGADADLREALTLMDVPRSRRFRDDISVVVLFFD